MKQIHRDIVSALIVSQDGKLLMGMKDPSGGGVYADCWHIPGGGIEPGEDQIQALTREVKEEVGININSAKVLLVDDQGRGTSTKIINGEKLECLMNFYVYRVDISLSSNEIKVILNDDLKKYEWVMIDQLSNYKLTPPSISLFTRLGWLK